MTLEDEIKGLIKETKKGMGLAILAIGISLILLTIPSVIKLAGYTAEQEWLFVIVYIVSGAYIIYIGYQMRPKKRFLRTVKV